MGNSRLGFSHRFWRWLERFGFKDDPFALYEAEREHNYLPFFFVDRPYLYDVLGTPTHPQTAFLMAGRGDGKTATRQMVAYECAYGKLRWKVLPVHYYDFSLLIEAVQGDLSKLTPRHHIRGIIRAVIKALADEVPALLFDRLEEMDRGLLMGYALAFGDPIAHLKLTKVIPDPPIQLDWEQLTPIETLTTLANLVVQLGDSAGKTYEAIYILVDCVDETSAGAQSAAALLYPLVNEQTVLETPHLAFKFFLPVEVGEALQQKVSLRPDRLCVRAITWNRDALRDVVQQRLAYYSEDVVKRLEDICTSAAKMRIMDRLLDASEGSPRTLLRLCQSLIHHHVTRTDDTLIDSVDVTDTLADFLQRREAEQQSHLVTVPVESQNTNVTFDTPPDTGLYLASGSGHVWVDGQQLAPPLSPQEFKLLEILYRHAPHIVAQDEIIESVWPSSTWVAGESYGEQNLRKLISRLRKRLAPNPSDEETRFVKNARGRGYWLKLQ
ncbi:MAG: winged helix-turn-helix transcriptional regulator [Anaerolineae bacterium]|nr:winged helix-turn-helix transcriptional regulator [Anaerolineae bacterium]